MLIFNNSLIYMHIFFISTGLFVLIMLWKFCRLSPDWYHVFKYSFLKASYFSHLKDTWYSSSTTRKLWLSKQYKQTLSALSIPLWRPSSILYLWLEQRNFANAFLKEKGMSMHKYFSTFNNDLQFLYVSHREDSDISACHRCVMQSVNRCLNCDMNIPISPTSWAIQIYPNP